MENEGIIIDGSQPEVNVPQDDNNVIKGIESHSDISSFWNKFRSNRKLFGFFKTLFILSISLITSFFIVYFILYVVPVFQEVRPSSKTEKSVKKEIKQDAAYKKQINLMTKDIQRLSRKYNAFTSGQSYIVINTTDNRFFLFRNKKMIREGFCSSGSYTMLQTEGNRQWIFKTPKGKYWIHGKTTNPVWKKPDWSFVEEGLPIPPKDDFSRYEYGVLGDYALAIGDGYLIHGTIYKRFLGMPVTHGCVRLNDEDLEVIYNTLSIGSKVYIF